MGFVIFKKTKGSRKPKYDFVAARISENNNKTFILIGNPKFKKNVKDYKFFEIFYDINFKKLALKPLKETTDDTYSISSSCKSAFIVSITSLIKSLDLTKFSNKTYKFEYENGLWIADLNKPLE